MKIPAKDKIWIVPSPAATYRQDSRFLLGCERCATTCCTNDPCTCCRARRARSTGGSKYYVPDDGKGHMQLMAMDKFRELYESEPVA